MFQSRVITAAMVVLGFSDKTSGLTKYPLPSNMDKMRKSQKLNLLCEISAKVVDTFVFQSGSDISNFVDGVLSEEERGILAQQQLTAEEDFPADFQVARSLLNAMAKQEGTMKSYMNHPFRLTIPHQ